MKFLVKWFRYGFNPSFGEEQFSRIDYVRDFINDQVNGWAGVTGCPIIPIPDSLPFNESIKITEFHEFIIHEI